MKFLKSKRFWLFIATLGMTQIQAVQAKTAAVLSPTNQAVVVAGVAALTKIIDEAK